MASKYTSEFYEEDPHRYALLLKALSKFNLDLTPSGAEGGTSSHIKQAEEFWRDLWDRYDGPEDDDSRVAWVQDQVPRYFRSLTTLPRWIQNPNWPFAGGKPMIFVGQLDVDVKAGNLAAQFFHHDVSYYLFIPSLDLIDSDEFYPPRIIMQRW